MKQFCQFLTGAFLLCFFSYISNAQELPGDSVLLAQAKHELISYYKSKLGENLQLYNGEEYIRSGQKVKGSPFFGSAGAITGSVFYNGKLYEEVQLYYDLVNNEVVINNFAKSGTIKLVPEKISYFSFPDHYFVHLLPTQQNAEIVREGFYDRLVDGKISVYARREKQLKVSSSADEDAKYLEYNYYFIRKNDRFYKVDDKSSLLNLLIDKKDQLKKFIKANKLNFRKRLEEAIVKTTNYYIQLIN